MQMVLFFALILGAVLASTHALANRPFDTDTATASSIHATTPTIPPSLSTGKLPVLGWNSWNAFRGDINEEKILSAANHLVSLGLKDVGYEYVNIDDCWAQILRDPKTWRMRPDAKKFPQGISGVASKVHALGLKLGIYSDAGVATCEGYPGSLGYESVDAEAFSEWGVDYLKYDNCNVPGNWSDTNAPQAGDWYNSNTAIRYRRMTAALSAQSRPIQFAICTWGEANVWDWGARVGHSWRMSKDSRPNWSSVISAIESNIAHLDKITFYGHNDMDMMEIGNGDLSIQEQRTHFSAWAFLKSPILLGTDLSKLMPEQLAILKNRELLAFHQDITIGTPAFPFTAYPGASTNSPPEYYSGKSSKGVHVFIINTSFFRRTKQFVFANVPGLSPNEVYQVHDMWTGKDLPGKYTINSTFSISVASHDTMAYLIEPILTPSQDIAQ